MAATLDKFAAGQLLHKRRDERELTQEQVVRGTTVSVAAHLSELENGKVNPGRSKHFPSFSALLGLSDEDIRSINLSAVITVAVSDLPLRSLTDAERWGWMSPPTDEEPEILALLQEAADKYGYGENAPICLPSATRYVTSSPSVRGISGWSRSTTASAICGSIPSC